MPDLDSIQWELGSGTRHDFDVLRSPGPALHAGLRRERRERIWRLVARQMTLAEWADLQTVFDATRGPVGTTTFTPPGESATTVAFVDDALTPTRVGADTMSIALEVIEVP